ncbi:NAD-dependent epimerase/dehydratase [Flavobacterium longum]|uniref:TIGR01777 family oxidoreductase n=1 Tax=Flavobacterium longum TaxID=1299340 RepID=UPI0039EAA4CD
MRVLITGATGLVGNALTDLLLSEGISIHYLTTAKNKLKSTPGKTGFYWNPEAGEIDESALIGVDAIVHLAGATISKRWTDSYKQEIIESRILSANLLFNLLRKNPHEVKQIVSASAIGIYKDSLDTVYREDATQKDDGFLGHVVQKWEESIDKFKILGLKTCKLRTGIVLSRNGGALPQMAKPIEWYVGAPLGSGRQFMSWIHLEDLTRMYLFALTQGLDGVFNATAPNPVTNKDFTKMLAKRLHRPLILPNVPAFALKLLLGEMHLLLVSSQNVNSEKIRNAGFDFKYNPLGEALDDLYPQ